MTTEDISGKINEVSEDIWSSMVNIPLQLIENPRISRLSGTVTSSVQIVGCWHGAVCLDMGNELAIHATASLIGANPSEISHDDVRDAAGELANMTAGGIKELLPDPCQISLPTVVMGTEFEFSVPQGIVLYRSMFETEFGNFLVTLIKAEDPGEQPSGGASAHREWHSTLSH
jgi:chemotaxis protein CheX